MFEIFAKEFPQEEGMIFELNPDEIEEHIERELQVSIPPSVSTFWREFSSGYYGERMLYFFGNGVAGEPRDSFQDWNSKDFWKSIFPKPNEGGPIFFAETSFGDQIGFRWEGGRCIFIIFLIDTFESLIIAENDGQFFQETLNNRYALVDRSRYEAVRSRLGTLQTGMHYAPIVSPILGGSGNPENFAFETPKVHFSTAIYAYSTGKPLRIEV